MAWKRYRVSGDRIAFSGMYTVVFLLVSAVAFGSFFYGQISPKLGGAKPQLIAVGLTEEARRALPKIVVNSGDSLIQGQLIYQTPSFVYMTVSDKTLRLRAGDVVTMLVTPEPATGSK